jgi:hypothetical protein
MAVERKPNTGLLVADDVRNDGQVGVGIGRDGVHVAVLPAKGCFAASTSIGPAEAREIAAELVVLADRVEAREAAK